VRAEPRTDPPQRRHEDIDVGLARLAVADDAGLVIVRL
jgi:hypothetical protein